MLKRIWNDPVWSAVIATAIVTAVATAVSYFAGWLPGIIAAATRVAAFIGSTTPVPNWLLAILILCVLAVIGRIVIGVGRVTISSEAEPSFRDYKEDSFLGILWCWRYGTDGGIYDLVSFCPSCDFQVYARDISAFRAIPHLQYRCDDCGSVLGEFEMPLREVENLVTRHIHKKLRNESWRLSKPAT